MKEKILIVEDEQIEAMDFTQLLNSFGYDVVDVAATGEDALLKVAEHKPDLVLMDMKLKGDIDGLEAAVKINDEFDVPVVYLTALPEKTILDHVKLTPPSALILKPVNKIELKNTIKITLYRHQLESKLKKSNRRYLELVDYSVVTIYESNLKGDILFANDYMAKMFEYADVDELQTENIFKLYKNRADREKFIKKLKKYKVISQYECDGLTKSGRTINLLINAHLLDDSISGMIMNITKRKKAEEELKLANLYNRRLIEASLDPMVTIGPDGKITDANTATEKVTGYKRDKLIGTDFSDYFTEPDKSKEGYEKAFKNGFVRDYPLEIKNIDGSITSVLYNASTYKDGSDNVIGVFAAARDITERQRIENIMQARFRLLEFASSHSLNELIIATLNEIERLTDSNVSFYVLVEPDQQTFKLQNWSTNTLKISSIDKRSLQNDIFHDDILRSCVSEQKAVIYNDHSSTSSHRLESHIPLTRELLVPIIRDNLVKAIIGVGNKTTNYDKNDIEAASRLGDLSWDITERKMNENAIFQAKEEWEHTFDAVPDLITLLDTNFKVLRVNKSMASKLGIEPKESVGLTCYNVIHGLNEPPSFCPHLKLLEDKQEHIAEIQEDNLGGTFIVSVSPLHDSEGELTGSVHVARDITKRTKAENKVKKSLKEKELLIKEIHHRVKNNLQIIYSLHDLQELFIDENPLMTTFLNESKNRILSMAMIHEMLYQSKDLSRINFSDYIKNLVENLFYTHGTNKNINISFDLEDFYPNIETSIPLGLIVNELISNSLKYAFSNNKAGEISISLNSYDNGHQLTISDNGMGLPDDLDLKNPEKNLGFSLVNSLVQQLDGSIDLDRSQGTKYTINFNELNYKERY